VRGLEYFWYESKIGGILREIRPWQWYKQSVMFLGIIFSRSLLSTEAWLNLVLGVFSFCAVAGANYIFNDINDLEEDRNHPEKKNRPIAKGQIGVKTASIFGVVLALSGFYAAYLVGKPFLAVLAAYLVLSTVYSVYLKYIAFVDVIIVALCFVLRAIAGVVAIEVMISPWLIFTVLLAALMLAVSKRRQEYSKKSNPGESRPVLEDYSEKLLDNMFLLVSTSLIVAYSLYSFFGANEFMMLTLPFAYYAIFRYWYLSENTEIGEKPHRILLDRPMVLNLILWTAISIAVLYNLLNLIGVSL
jgi:4-hydroxybenzoate polyprenyltransferase